MKSHIFIFLCVVALTAFYSCSKPGVPAAYTDVKQSVKIYPDYKDIVVPPNIAPLNFMVKENGTQFVVTFKAESGKAEITAVAGKDGKVLIDEYEWKNLLAAATGADIAVSVYAETGQGWVKYPDYKIKVASEPVDAYVSYRLIEPGYEVYRQLGLYQRNLTNFDVQTIYENNRTFNSDDNHCINCHNYQNYSARSMLFHVRGKHGGTVVATNGGIVKMNMKNDSILSSTVYPTWHPKHPYVVFSSNKTGQIFHILDNQKIEVIDTGSDLVFYDVKRRALRNILKTHSDFETFPCWNPEGNKIYYTSAHIEALDTIPDSLFTPFVKANYNNIRYDVRSLMFDEKTQTFGAPQTEVDCAAAGKSASVPRVSPDGRYLLFTLGDFGQFHIWHRSADLYIKDLTTGEVRPLSKANSKDTESYHGWSSNGRWIVFTSRRDDGSFTRLYLTYFDKDGRDHKAFIIPQHDPMQNIELMKSYNVPEMTRDAVPYAADDFKKAIYSGDGTAVKYEAAPAAAK